jgi:hypothetical protein
MANFENFEEGWWFSTSLLLVICEYLLELQ